MQAGVVGEHAVVAQGDVFLLPLFVQRLPATLQQHALRGEGAKGESGRAWVSFTGRTLVVLETKLPF